MDAAERAGNAIERRVMRDINAIYTRALKDALADQKSFLAKIADIDAGRIKPPAFYDTPEKVLKWRQGFTRELIRKQRVVEGIQARLKEAGKEAAPVIQNAMTEVYGANRAYTADVIAKKTNVSFAQYDKRQIDILLQDNMPPFSKIAYKGMGANHEIVRKLSREMAQATINGESQRDIVKRIREVTGQSKYQAQRVAQTERTRVQSQARAQAMDEAAAMGVKVTKTWSARMVNTRDTHGSPPLGVDGETVPNDQPFSNGLMYPGDPIGDAFEVINCHCVLIPGVA
ncbi:MAG TPA: phage minor head protein [Candidatus Limiplasma sp.]|nr:phage minor head protein [Candidatus Limiplasma sp.]